MTHGSLFSGIGGADLAARQAGFRNLFQVEIDPYCQMVLKKNFPESIIYGDIKKFDGRQWRGRVDIISGGFPCQPYSLAGKRRGEEDDRALWGEMFRVIDEARPSWVVGENVIGLVSLGLDAVLSDLEDLGYAAQTFCIPAVAVGALHWRDRIWVVANRNDDPSCGGHQQVCGQEGESPATFQSAVVRPEDGSAHSIRHGNGTQGDAAHPCVIGRDELRFSSVAWQPTTIAELLRVGYGVPDGLDQVGRLSAESKKAAAEGRGHRVRALGNAIVPAVMYNIFVAIAQVEK